MWSDVDKVRLILSDFRGFFFKKTVVGPTYNWFRGPHIRWDPHCWVLRGPRWGPYVGPICWINPSHSRAIRRPRYFSLRGAMWRQKSPPLRSFKDWYPVSPLSFGLGKFHVQVCLNLCLVFMNFLAVYKAEDLKFCSYQVMVTLQQVVLTRKMLIERQFLRFCH